MAACRLLTVGGKRAAEPWRLGFFLQSAIKVTRGPGAVSPAPFDIDHRDLRPTQETC